MGKFNREFEASFNFDSGDGAMTLYVGGYYDFFAGNDDFSPGAINWGAANSPYGAHFFVVLGAVSVDVITITVTGTSWDPATGTRTAADSEDITIPNATPANTYFETTKQWIGQISIQTTGGTAKDCNYGWVTYWTNQEHQFWLKGFELTGYALATDAGTDFLIYHHQATGWTYNGGAAPTPPTPIAQFTADFNPENDLNAGDHFRWPDYSLSVQVDGHENEGLIFCAVQSQARPFINCNLKYRISSAR